MLSRPRSEFPIFCKICSARECFPPRLFLFTPVSWRAKTKKKRAVPRARSRRSLRLTTSLIVLLGVLTTPYLINAIAGGFSGEKRELTIRLVRILFPSAGLLVFSAWCLGVLNSHRRFFLSYSAPVVWNAAMIATMWGWGGRYAQFPLAQIVAWGSVAGSTLQVVVQLPAVLHLLQGLHLTLDYKTENVKTVVRNFIPVFVGRGVVQISAYVDTLLASWLPMGAVAGLSVRTDSLFAPR